MEIEPKDLSKLLAAGEDVLLVDVRQPWEHETARLPKDVLLPLNELPARASELKPKPGQKVVCYCHHGARSLRAAGFLRSVGIPDALSLRGGIDAWQAAGLPRELRGELRGVVNHYLANLMGRRPKMHAYLGMLAG